MLLIFHNIPMERAGAGVLTDHYLDGEGRRAGGSQQPPVLLAWWTVQFSHNYKPEPWPSIHINLMTSSSQVLSGPRLQLTCGGLNHQEKFGFCNYLETTEPGGTQWCHPSQCVGWSLCFQLNSAHALMWEENNFYWYHGLELPGWSWWDTWRDLVWVMRTTVWMTSLWLLATGWVTQVTITRTLGTSE